ncbi:hypothetical protein D3C81_853070 [compost metagenome]
MEKVHDGIVEKVSFLVAIPPEEISPAGIHAACEVICDGERLVADIASLVAELAL